MSMSPRHSAKKIATGVPPAPMTLEALEVAHGEGFSQAGAVTIMEGIAPEKKVAAIKYVKDIFHVFFTLSDFKDVNGIRRTPVVVDSTPSSPSVVVETMKAVEKDERAHYVSLKTPFGRVGMVRALVPETTSTEDVLKLFNADVKRLLLGRTLDETRSLPELDNAQWEALYHLAQLDDGTLW